MYFTFNRFYYILTFYLDNKHIHFYALSPGRCVQNGTIINKLPNITYLNKKIKKLPVIKAPKKKEKLQGFPMIHFG